MTQLQRFIPVMYLGSYSFSYGPQITFDWNSAVAHKPVLNASETTEPTGPEVQRITLEGFLASDDTNQALLDFLLFSTSPKFVSRPLAVGFFTQDASSPLSSQVWYSNVMYLETMNFKYLTGHSGYKYPYRIPLSGAQPLTVIPTSTAISSSTSVYSFPMSGLSNGFIAGIQLKGSNYGTGSLFNPQSISNVKNNSSVVIGSGPTLGAAQNRLFAPTANPSFITDQNGSSLYWPLIDTNGNQSIQVLNPTGSYSIQWAVNWLSGFLPSAINLVYVPL